MCSKCFWFLVGGGGFSGRFSFVYRGGLLQHHTFGATADRSSLLSPYERASSLGDRALSLSLGLKIFLLLLFSHSLFPFPLSPSCAQTPNCRLLFTHSHPFSQLSDPLPPLHPSPLLSSSLPPRRQGSTHSSSLRPPELPPITKETHTRASCWREAIAHFRPFLLFFCRFP